MTNSISDHVMVIVYWALTLWWTVVLSFAVAYIYWKRSSSTQNLTTQTKAIMYGFLWLAVLFLLDSLYWSLANTARVGLIADSVNLSAFMYKSWLISTIKALFLLAGIIFLSTVIKTRRQIERNIETLYFTRYADQTVDAIGVLNPRGAVVYWNKGAEALYRQPRMQVLGRHIKDFLVPPDLHEEMDKTLEMIRETGNPARFRAPRLTSDKKEIEVDITISPFIQDTGEFGGYFGIMRPVNASNIKKEAVVDAEVHSLMMEQLEKSETKKLDTIIRQIARSAAKEERLNEKRYVLEGAIAVTLLIAACILILLTTISNEQYKYIFAIGTVMAVFLEIQPIRFFFRNRTNIIRTRAMRRLLSLPNVENEHLKMALEMMDTTEEKTDSSTVSPYSNELKQGE